MIERDIELEEVSIFGLEVSRLICWKSLWPVDTIVQLFSIYLGGKSQVSGELCFTAAVLPL